MKNPNDKFRLVINTLVNGLLIVIILLIIIMINLYVIEKTNLAIAGAMFVLFVISMIVSVRQSNQRRRHEEKRLEALVDERTVELNQQYALMGLVNDTAAALLESDTVDYSDAMNSGMEMLAGWVGVGRVRVWRNNRMDDGKLYYTQVCVWESEYLDPLQKNAEMEFRYEDTLPRWEGFLSSGGSINGPLDDLPEEERVFLAEYGIQSVLSIPIFLKGAFWGFISFEDCNQKRVFPEGDVNILRSWGLLVIGAIQRGEIAVSMQHTLTKLEAVIKNYKGVIWSIDANGVITTFNGRYLETIGVTPSFLEGKKLEIARLKNRHLDIIENVEKTFREGPQDWISDIDGGVYHSSTMPMSDGEGNVIGVVGSTDDVTEMYKLQRDLETAVEAAEAANRAKSVFLANMSHEIRTPMNAIIGMTSIGLSASDAERMKYCFTRIEDASKHLLGVINDILDMSKIEADKFELSPAKFNFEKILKRVVNVINFRVDEKRQKFTVHIDNVVPKTLIGDDQRLAQVITNLLGNAVKFTPEGGSVSLDARFLGEEDGVCTIQISVTDTGIGISPEQQAHLFQSFAQAESSTTRKFGGTGLGLKISKSIVEMMGGKIWVESELGKGATFAFTVQVKRGSKEMQDDQELTEEARPNVDGLFAGFHILLAEDMEINCEIVQALLEPTLLSIDCAENGAVAVRMFCETPEKYDMILMDVQMPEMDGYEATRSIRALDISKGKTIPILAMTANVFREDIEKCLEAGMNDHLGKPLAIDEVVEKLRTYLL